jgi:trk system potassium uptake protein TrkH
MILIGAVPYYLSHSGISIADSIFESSSGFATTGATTIAYPESLSAPLLLWRSISYWAGGMGIIVLTVALMPLLGVGGFQLVKAETSGPDKEKIMPKITSAAKVLWLIYICLTVLLSVFYLAGGMTLFDAVCHAMTIVSTGGASTKNNGLAAFNSTYINVVTTVFMIIGALNFNLYIQILQGKIKDVFRNTEARTFFCIFFAALILVSANLIPYYHSSVKALEYAAFYIASILSTSGLVLNDYELWPPFAQSVLFILMFIGGCSGSTAGGLKVIRISVLFKQAGTEIKKMIYPQGVFSVRLNNKAGRKNVVYAVASFVFLYFLVIAITTLITAASGVDIFTSISAALVITGNIGTGFAQVGPTGNYSLFADHIKLLFSFVMIAARLELWTVLILFTRSYWRSV